MKRLLAVLLALSLLLTTAGVWAEETEKEPSLDAEETLDMADTDAEFEDGESGDEEDEEEEEEIPWIEYDYDELRVGNPTPMDGKFFTGMWGNATTDIDVRTLVNSYYLTVWGYDTGIFRENRQVVSGLAISEIEENGDREYYFALCDDLYYSDGTPITAWDYAFSVLFQGAPEIVELGGLPMDLSYLQGYEEYYRGEVDYLSGVRVVSDRMIVFTVRHEYLPYFFELYRMGFLPYPIHEIAPGCKVYDDGQGVYIGNEDPSIEERIFSADLLRSTVMDPEYGYLSHPTVGSGPYVLTSWDGEVCTFEINPYFKGDEEGNMPTIPHLRFTLAENEDMIEKLSTGEFGLLNKVTKKDTILEGLGITGGQYTMTNYPRIGLTFIVFTPDRKALQTKAVRQAINHCLDKDQVVDEYVGDFGLPMDGLIGLGQWMYQLVSGTLEYPVNLPEDPTPEEEKEYEETIEEWEKLNLDGLWHYDLDTEKAIQLLEKDGWTLNQDGEPFDKDRDEVRYKDIDGELVGLDLTCAYPEENYTATSMETLFIPYLKEAGIRLTLIPMDMKTLLRSYNDRDIEEIDMFYLGDDFNIEFDPQLFFLPGDWERPEEDNLDWTHAWMYEMARRMCETEPHDTLGFMQKWIAFQEELSEYLPLIPVYSNVYFDFYTVELQNYLIEKYVTWGDAMVPATFHEYVEPVEEEGDEELGEDEMFFD